MDKTIKEIIENATFVFISTESSREDLLEIIESQLGWWKELKDYIKDKKIVSHTKANQNN
jgi:hypothetical protein